MPDINKPHEYFQIEKKDKNARTARIILKTGIIKTPAFMPVATNAALKAVTTEQNEKTGAYAILANAYHLMIRPGCDIIKDSGGIHNFMKWKKPIITDSGGFQIFSLASLCSVKNDGVIFRSHINGDKHFLSPKSSMQIQHKIGADIHMVLDQCIALPADKIKIENAHENTIKWAFECKENFDHDSDDLIFAINQGGLEIDIRKKSAEKLQQIGFHGYAIGGLSVGEKQADMCKVLDNTCKELDCDKPRYLMGVGTPQDIVKAVRFGVDMFDCIIPTRQARHAVAFTDQGKINLRNAKYARDHQPINENSQCSITNTYTKAYLHHLIKAKEILAHVLITQINLAYYQKLMQKIREAIEEQKFEQFAKTFE